MVPERAIAQGVAIAPGVAGKPSPGGLSQAPWNQEMPQAVSPIGFKHTFYRVTPRGRGFLFSCRDPLRFKTLSPAPGW